MQPQQYTESQSQSNTYPNNNTNNNHQHHNNRQILHPTKYGPPSHIKPRPYSIMLELLETQANKSLTNEYYSEVTKTLSHLESISSVNPAMIDLQPEIQWFMRPFLLDFLIELHSSFKLQPQTLFLCLNIIDRYCAKRIVFKRHYQLVGCTALWVAGKYEDKKSRVPTLKELTIMCRNAYDEEMFVQMEMHILSTLEWSLSHPNLEDCLQLAINSSNIANNTTPTKYNKLLPSPASNHNNSASTLSAVTAIGRFLCELSLYDKCFLSVPTSLVSITANLLACSMLQIPNGSNSLLELMKKALPKKSSLNNRRQGQQTLYANNNESNYSHHNNNSFANIRHASFDTDIIDYDDTENDDDDEEEDDDFIETDEEHIDEDEDSFIENKQPEVHGAFLSGLDENSLLSIKKIALLFIIQLSKVTEVLSKKYETLGVIQVINNFHTRFTFIIQSIYENQDSIISNPDQVDSKLIQFSEVLLQFPKLEEEKSKADKFYHNSSSNDFKPPQSPFIFSSATLNLNINTNDSNHLPAPATPPSASSQNSVFSNKRNNSSSTCVTPIHANMASSLTYNSGSSSILRNNSKMRISKNSGSSNNNSTNNSNNNNNKSHQHNSAAPTNSSRSEFSPLTSTTTVDSNGNVWSSPIMQNI
ncbi:hypothetical protein DFJ63DRAFT_312308 [Scheffersomyces coipomensis]|uniref:uncharacterized protein n=1 Tax=Scheffersomyces coipomensis TaxID=1788519 RepID=UPI00315D5275